MQLCQAACGKYLIVVVESICEETNGQRMECSTLYRWSKRVPSAHPLREVRRVTVSMLRTLSLSSMPCKAYPERRDEVVLRHL